MQQNCPEWLEISRKKVTGSHLPALFDSFGKKIEMTWNIVKNGTAEPEMKHMKNIPTGHRFEDVAAAQFESIKKCKKRKTLFFHFENYMRYVSCIDALGPFEILLEMKTWAEGVLFSLKSLNTVPQYFVQCHLQMRRIDAEFEY